MERGEEEIISRNRRHKKNFVQGWLIFFSLTAVFALMGVSMAVWQGEGVFVLGTVSTGEFNPVFTEIDTFGNQPGTVNPSISSNGKSISIYINDAEKNDVYKLKYTISNKGTIPLKLDIDGLNKDSDSGLRLLSNTLPQRTLEPEENIKGRLRLKIDRDLDERTIYDFDIELLFKQWNMVN